MSVDSSPLHVIDSGGEGPPLIYVNGLFQNAQSWGAMDESLQRYVRTIRMDLRNQGSSPATEHACLIDQHVADISAAIDRMGVDEFHLIGHSYGCRIATRVARRYGKAVQSLTLVGASAPDLRDRYLMVFRAWLRAFDSQDKDVIRDGVLPWVYAGGYLAAQPGLIDFYAGHLSALAADQRLRNNLLGLIASYEAIDAAMESGAGISARVLVLQGEEDAISSPALVARWTRSFDRATYTSVPQAGHALMAEQNQFVEQKTLDFILED